MVDVEDGGIVWSYTEFGSDGVVTIYSPSEDYSAQYHDGNIEVLEGLQWEDEFAAKYTFDEQTQSIWISDIKEGTIEKTNDDEFVLSKSGEHLQNGTYRRVKGFKTVEYINASRTSDYYKDGREPEIDYEKATVNGVKYDNETNKCWKYTITTTVLGISASSEDYSWGTEFAMVCACELCMYQAAQTSVTKAKYSYVEVPNTDENKCSELSQNAQN